jgi:cob(I)alamin adenosyltransferase
MAIYTKKGDQGQTSFLDGCPVRKDDVRIEALGALDELNSMLGLTLCFVQEDKLREMLENIQNTIFTIGADLASSGLKRDSLPRMGPAHVVELESTIDRLENKLGLPKKFILPGGTISSSFLHMCRAITRRAERSLVSANQEININPHLLSYVNRLSDLLYVLAREANKELDVNEQQPIYKYFKEKT